MKIALVHYRAGLMDGVSLEMEKWKKVLERMGNEVNIVAGNETRKTDKLLKSISLETKGYMKVRKNAFEGLKDISKNELMELIKNEKEKILKDIDEVLKNYDLVIPNNILSLGIHVPAAIAFSEYIKNSDKKFIGHHHDFWWEREYIRCVSIPEIGEILENNCPPDFENIKHVVINSIARKELKKRKNLDSFVIPNVMDFSIHSKYRFKELNKKIRDQFNIGYGTIVILQATRIVPRKAIEVAIDVVHELNKILKNFTGERLYNGEVFDGKVVLAFSGMCEKDSEWYMNRLLEIAHEKSVNILNLYPVVRDGKWDFMELYSVADIVSYPTILEGWGNQLLEAIVFKKPLIMFEYEVFKRDIKKHGLKYISLGDEYNITDGLVKIRTETIRKVAKETLELLFDAGKYKEYVEENFEIGKVNFSLEKLEEILEDLLSFCL